MRYGISAAALIVQRKQLLLVNHRARGQYDFWVPPGGKLQGSESIFDCARRETMEETGLSVVLDRIIYIVEYAEPGYHFCKFFIRCKRCGGKSHPRQPGTRGDVSRQCALLFKGGYGRLGCASQNSKRSLLGRP